MRSKKINLDCLDLTPTWTGDANGHTATLARRHDHAPKVDGLDSSEPDFDAGAVERQTEVRDEKVAAKSLPTESTAERLQRIHAERAAAEREKVRRERVDMMGRSASPTARRPAPPAAIPAARVVENVPSPSPSPSPVADSHQIDHVHEPKYMMTPTVLPAIDPEIHAIGQAHAVLAGLDEAAIRRALDYLGRKLIGGSPGTTG